MKLQVVGKFALSVNLSVSLFDSWSLNLSICLFDSSSVFLCSDF